jgi:hypothetical protein
MVLKLFLCLVRERFYVVISGAWKGKGAAVNGDGESDEDDEDDDEGRDDDEEDDEAGDAGLEEHRASDRDASKATSRSAEETAIFRSLQRGDTLPYESPLSRHNLPSARWDLGYEHPELLSPTDSDPSSSPSSSGGSVRGSDAGTGKKSIAQASKMLVLKTVGTTR